MTEVKKKRKQIKNPESPSEIKRRAGGYDIRKVGRPRITSLPPEEMIELGKEMIEFVSDRKNKVLHISEWYCINKGFLEAEFKKFIEKEEFRPYYEKAMRMISKRYLDGTINPSIAQRWQRLYFSDLRDQENSDLDRAAERSKEIAATVTEETVNAFEALANQIYLAQSSQSSRKIDDINNKADNKS